MKAPEFKWGVEFSKHGIGFALGAVLCFEKVNGERLGYLSVMLGFHTFVIGRYMY